MLGLLRRNIHCCPAEVKSITCKSLVRPRLEYCNTVWDDLPMMVKSKVRLFADDCIVYREIGNERDAQALQEDIDSLCRWESQWQMSFNPSKCYTMHVSHKAKPIITPYTMKGKRLEQVSHHPYLGLELSKDLTWSHHINKITTKANQMLGIVRRNLHSCSKSVKNTAYKKYKTLVRPRLEFCAAIWDPHQATSKKKIETIQRRAARFVAKRLRQRIQCHVHPVQSPMGNPRKSPHQASLDRLI